LEKDNNESKNYFVPSENEKEEMLNNIDKIKYKDNLDEIKKDFVKFVKDSRYTKNTFQKRSL